MVPRLVTTVLAGGASRGGKGTLVSKVPVISKLQKRTVYDGQKQPTENAINDHYEKLHSLVIGKS